MAARGLCEKGKPSGVFLPGRAPQPGETWYIVEGVKDAAALYALGYLVVGMPKGNRSSTFENVLFCDLTPVVNPSCRSP